MTIKTLKTLVRAASLRQLRAATATLPYERNDRLAAESRREALLAVLEACDADEDGDNAKLLREMAR